MERIIEIQKRHSYILSMIFGQTIVSGLKMLINQENFDKFYSEESLIYLKDLLESKDVIFDDDKIDLIKEYMINYISVSRNSNIVNICKEILYVLKTPRKSTLKNFYQYQLYIRTNVDDKLKGYESRKDLNYSISLDYMYLEKLTTQDCNISSLKDDIYCLYSISAMILESPILLKSGILFENIVKLIYTNKQSTSQDVCILSNRIEKIINDYENVNKQLDDIYQEKLLTGLIFSTEIKDVLDIIEKDISSDKFFNEEQFNVFEKVIIEGSEKCIFDYDKTENAYVLLEKFRDSLKLPNSKQNNIKLALNKMKNTEWQRNNINFYLENYELRYDEKVKDKYRKLLYEAKLDSFKKVIDKIMAYDSTVLAILLGSNCDLSILSSYPVFIYNINYILKKYPFILENPTYCELIEYLLEYNSARSFDKIVDIDAYLQNNKILKKIKKLQK